MSLQEMSSGNATVRNSPNEIRRPRSVRSGRNEKLSAFIKPMLATIADKPFDDPDWIFEIKWDGYRAIAEVGAGEPRLYSRNGLSFLNLYPAIAKELSTIKTEAVLDGEIVVLNKNNKPDFQKLQQYEINPSLPILFYVFDCLSYKGKDITDLPLTERKKIAEKVLGKSKIVRYADHVSGDGKAFFAKIVDMDLEGMIAKNAASKYYSGKRSRDWLKIKNHNTQEAVIAGFTAPKGSREYFGALILGIYDDQKLKYIGHTGTGFTAAILKDVYGKLKPLQRATSPFEQKISVNSPVTWVEPQMVCAIKYSEMTQDGILRHPVFMGLRIDKPAKEADTLDAAAKPATAKKRKRRIRRVSLLRRNRRMLSSGSEVALSPSPIRTRSTGPAKV